ncbi:MAG: hypothetical protein Q9226_008163 [Calogaya cf. arnoldii]
MPATWTPTDRISLDWSIPILSRSQVLTKLHEVLNLIDTNGYAMVDVANTQSKVAVRLEENYLGAMRLVRYSRPCKKDMKKEMVWFAKAVTCVEQLVQQIGRSENVSFRQAYYNNTISHPGMTPSAFKDLVSDIAVTCRMHPTSLGVDADENGEIFAGKDITLKVRRVENVFIHDPQKLKSKPIPSESPVPSRVLNIKCVGTVRAVLVIEHKNLMTQMEPRLASAQIFTILKYGCIRTSWATDSMCCSRLIWGGPTTEEMLQYHYKRVFGEWARLQGEKDRGMSPEDVQKAARYEWERVSKHLKGQFRHPCTELESNLFKSYFMRLELLGNEPVLRSELEMMLRDGNKFCIASLAFRNMGGLEEWIIMKIDSTVTEQSMKPGEIQPQNIVKCDNVESSTPKTNTGAIALIGVAAVHERTARTAVMLGLEV